MKKLLVFASLVLIAGIAYGQTIKKGGVIGFYETEFTLKPDVTMDQFLDFLTNKYIPGLNTPLEGVTFFILQSDRGVNEGNFAWAIYLESEEVRNKYFPSEGTTSDAYNSIIQKIQPLIEEFNNFATYTNVGGDWKVL